jgi:putative heme-binding domain-containing protein
MAVQTLGSSWPGEEKLLRLVSHDTFGEELKPSAAAVLFNVYRSWIHREAAQYLPKPATKESKVPPIKELLASTGNRTKGKLIFERYCMTCHRINNDGANFGPELTLIGEKLSKEGLFRSILYPNEGVSFGYETSLVKLADGTESMGIIANETAEEIILKLPGGGSTKYPSNKVSGIKKLDDSLMPELAQSMAEQDLIDLVEYLSFLRQ